MNSTQGFDISPPQRASLCKVGSLEGTETAARGSMSHLPKLHSYVDNEPTLAPATRQTRLLGLRTVISIVE